MEELLDGVVDLVSGLLRGRWWLDRQIEHAMDDAGFVPERPSGPTQISQEALNTVMHNRLPPK